MNFSEEYEFCTGICGISKAEYLSLTPAETYNKVQAYIYNRDMMSANFRMLYTLQFNQWAKRGQQKQPAKLWPLSFDTDHELPAEEMYARNAEIIEQYYQRHPEKMSQN